MNLPSKAVAAALVAASLATVATPADAQWGWRRGWGFGLAAGAIIGGAIAASSYGYYGYPYGYRAYAYYPAYGYPYASYRYSPGYYGYAYAPAYYGGGYPRARVYVRRAYW